MLWDVRPKVSIDLEEAQLADISPGYADAGPNKWDNCGAANYAWILKQLGFGDPYEPQQVMDLIEGKNYHGGEVSAHLVAFFKGHISNCPDIVVEGRPDIIDRLRAIAGTMLTTNWWWSNSNGDIQPRNTGILHWSSAIYDTGAALGIRNTMRGQVVELSYGQARAAYAGEFTVFHHALPGGVRVLDPNDPVVQKIVGTYDTVARQMYHPFDNGPDGKPNWPALKAMKDELDAINGKLDSLGGGKPTVPYDATITPK